MFEGVVSLDVFVLLHEHETFEHMCLLVVVGVPDGFVCVGQHFGQFGLQ